MGSEPKIHLSEDVSAAQVQSQSQPTPTSQEWNNTVTEVDQNFCSIIVLNDF
jgi:hypothetical protein